MVKVDKSKIDSAQTFEELSIVALDVLKKMNESGEPIVEICGPISTGGLGSLEKNLERIKRAIETANKNGLQVFDLIPFESAISRLMIKYPKTDGYCLPILDVFYRKIFESGYISRALFLPDWQSSRGATWERNITKSLNIKIEEYREEWLEEIDIIR